MVEQEFISREVVYFIGSGVAAFFMALFRTTRFESKEQRHFFMKLNEGFMCAMISSGIAVLVRTYFNAPYTWAIPIGVIVGFVGTNFIHIIIKSLIEFQVGKYTGGQLNEDLKRKLQELERKERNPDGTLKKHNKETQE